MIPIILLSDNKEEVAKFVEKKRRELQAIVIKIKPKSLTNEYSIKEIKEINREAHIFHKEVRIYLLEDFHFSSLPAQNAFLKLLEEPPDNTQFILTTINVYSLLPTIISRAKVIKLGKNREIKAKKTFFAACFEEIINQKTRKIPFSLFTVNGKESAEKVLEDIIIFFRKRLASDEKSPLILKETIRLKSLLDKNNLNPQLTLDHLLIFIYKCYNDFKQ